ncbi:BppU family phage baseplate upper protein [Latilactobacillus fragifolii]|uniref:BppU family phage baseplate upper protein n=1 Tax=Latilactobacillus fragifolii TaxID=2814244 RepID=UPI001ABA92F7|nr:BppU family phage baseplate upper protein [Latilactobacillus fragifolii]
MANQLIMLDLAAVEWTNQIVKGHIKDGELQVYDVQINENRIPKDLTEYKTGQFRGTNYKGEFVAKDIAVTAKDGKFTFKFPKTAFSVAGNFKQAYFVFTDSTGGQVSTEDFNILVLPDADADSTHADALVDEYNKYVKQLQDAYNNAKAGWDKQIADLKNKIAELKASIDKLDFYTKSQADNRFLITNVGTIGADTDWNTANSQGIYAVNAAKGANCPTGTTAVWGNLLALKVGGTIRQSFLGATTGGVDYVRSYSGSPAKWGAWTKTITDGTSENWQHHKIFKDNDFTLATCPKGTDFGDFLKSNSVPVGFSIIRDNNTAMNAMVIKENNNYAFAYSGGTANDFVRFSVNKGVASGWMRSLNTTDLPVISNWGNFTMRNGFTGDMHYRTTTYPGGKVWVDLRGRIANINGHVPNFVCDFPKELVPTRELAMNWAQPRNNELIGAGVSIGGESTSIRLNFLNGTTPSNFIEVWLSYWTDIV